jgi:hypothetical protein
MYLVTVAASVNMRQEREGQPDGTVARAQSEHTQEV